MSKKIGMGLVGPGFIAAHHLDAVRRLGDVEIIGLAGSSLESAEKKAKTLNAGKAYASYQELLADPAIDVIHNTTPNQMHFPVTMAAIEAGKHVISDKPLAITPEECAKLRDAAEAKGVVNAVTFNYRGNATVQHARGMVAAGEIGDVTYVHGQYLQDWLTDPNSYSWRLDPVKGGGSSALADIGSHWCDTAEHISGAKIVEVLADLTTTVKTRYAATGSVEAFSQQTDVERKAIEITAEDLATVLIRFDNGARGCLKTGQTLPGHKNDLRVEVNGSKASIGWLQEEQNDIWIGHYNKPNEMLVRDPGSMNKEGAPYAILPAGHQEGWADAFRNVVADAYTWIRTGTKPATICTFANGYHLCCVIDAMLKSHAAGGVWTKVQQ